MDAALRGLKDIEGVLGSFLLGEHGGVLARDMPAMFDDETLAQASLRLAQLRDAFEADGDHFEGCTARFGAHLLVLRAAEARTLCVLCPVGTNLNTLTMGVNLVSRRVSAPRQPRSFPPPAFSPAPTPALSPAPVPEPAETIVAALPQRESILPEPMPTTRFFRGRPVV